jgi:uncharacterized membrane protein
MTLESSRTLGGIGAILMFIGIIPYISYFGIIELIGLILVLVGLYGLGNYYHESGIFRNALYGVAAGIVGAVVAAVAVFAVVLSNITDLITQLYPGWTPGDWASIQGMTPNTSNLDPTALFPLIAGILVVFVVLWVFAIIATFFMRRSLKQVSNKSTVGLFGTAGLLLLIGAFLAIVFIGFILMWVAALLIAIAFFQLKPGESIVSQQTPPPPV